MAQNEPNYNPFHPADYLPPLHGNPALVDPRPRYAPPAVQTTDAGLSGGEPFPSAIGAWCECDRYEGPITSLGATPTFHNGRWYAKSGRRTLEWRPGVGAVDLANPSNLPIIDAANAVIDHLNTNGCTQASIPAVSTFQAQYNATGQPGQLTVDGQYGGNTQRALQNVMDQAQTDAGPSQAAPTNCFGMAVPATPALDPPAPAPAPPSGRSTVVVAPAAPASKTPWIIGGAVAAGAALIGYTYWRKHHRGHR